ncbi:MAG: hypothetical protein GC131_01010 [Alphaproteobacteria bacterium]|nr:hypothetical protein [Alphaproteobacteria bacterium]
MLKKTFRISIQILGAVLAVVAIALGAAIWRVASAPITFEEMEPYIEQALGDSEHGITAEVPSNLLVWDNEEFEFRFRVSGAKLFNAEGQQIALLPDLSMRLSLFSLLYGRVAPAEIKVERPQIVLERTVEGQFLFGGIGEADGASQMPADDGNKASFAEMLKQFLGIESGIIGGLGALSNLTIDHAIISIFDRATGKSWQVSFPFISFSRDWRGTYGTALVEITQGETVSPLRVNMAYQRDKKRISLTGSFTDINLSFLGGKHESLSDFARFDMPLSGDVTVMLNEDFALDAAKWDVKAGAGTLTAVELWPAPMKVGALRSEGDFDSRNLTANLKELHAELSGLKIEVSGKIRPTGADRGFIYDIDAVMRDLPMDGITGYWPDKVAVNPRAWIAENMTEGAFTELGGHFKGGGQWGAWEGVNLASAKGAIAMKNATIRYHDALPPVTGVGGTAEFDQNEMRIQVTGGKAAGMDLQPAPIVISGLSAEDQFIDITVIAKSPLKALLGLIDREPLGYATAVGLSPDKVQGEADVTVRFNFPLLKSLSIDQVKVTGEGRVKDFYSEELVPGYKLSNGKLDVLLDDVHLGIDGNVALNGVPLDIAWRENFPQDGKDISPRKTGRVTGTVTGEQWQMLDTTLYHNITGPTDVAIDYTDVSEQMSNIGLVIDGGKAGISYDDLNYHKSPGKPFLLEAAISMPRDQLAQIDTLRIDGDQANIDGTGMLDAKSFNLRSLTLDPFILGRNNAKMEFSADEKGAQKFVLSGKALDIASGEPPPKTEEAPKVEPQHKHPLEVNIKVGNAYTGESSRFTDLSLVARRDAVGWYNFDVQAKAEQGIPLSMWLRPEGKVSHLSIATDDLGAVLRSWDAGESIKGGRLIISGKGTPENPRVVEGTIDLQDYQVKDMPFLAVLINAVSLGGLADMLQGKGLNFDRLDGNFKLDGDTLVLKKIRTTGGGSLGLNMEGYIDLYTNEARLQGTVVPFDFFNRVVGSIPLVGDLITGGKGQGLIAAAYSAKGPLGNLDVSVNPASMLTPGIFRQMFFMDSLDGPSDVPKMNVPEQQGKIRGKLHN